MESGFQSDAFPLNTQSVQQETAEENVYQL